jgi:hypothetical protein
MSNKELKKIIDEFEKHAHLLFDKGDKNMIHESKGIMQVLIKLKSKLCKQKHFYRCSADSTDQYGMM